jgi:allantoate deiminase/N-carbamoyl-L-amino-acid hydrolase
MPGGPPSGQTVAAEQGAFGARIMHLTEQLARFSETPGSLTCTYLTDAHRRAAASLRDWMRAAGMSAQIDAVGNVTGHYPAASSDAKTLIVGSHYDTVRNAGNFDGRLGILTALAVIEHLSRSGRRLPFHIDLIAFSEEEGVRFAQPYIGSSAIAGRFDMKVLQRRDAKGISVGELIGQAGFNPEEAIPQLARRPADLCGYLELHIEQGPVLLQENLPVGIVTSIAGAARYLVTVMGVAGHAGTVPMPLRRDAAAAAAEIILAVEARCTQADAPTLVGTVGRLDVPDGAVNVIPGRCELSLDIRAGDDATRDAAAADILGEIDHIARRRNVKIEARPLSTTPAAPCSPRLQQALADAVGRAGLPVRHLVSGAGHDAVMFDGRTDIGMLFVRSGNGGISHSPLETITPADADVAARVLLDVLLNLTPAA